MILYSNQTHLDKCFNPCVLAHLLLRHTLRDKTGVAVDTYDKGVVELFVGGAIIHTFQDISLSPSVSALQHNNDPPCFNNSHFSKNKNL